LIGINTAAAACSSGRMQPLRFWRNPGADACRVAGHRQVAGALHRCVTLPRR